MARQGDRRDNENRNMGGTEIRGPGKGENRGQGSICRPGRPGNIFFDWTIAQLLLL